MKSLVISLLLFLNVLSAPLRRTTSLQNVNIYQILYKMRRIDDRYPVQGKPGLDYPTHTYIPHTLFNCADMEFSGLYADIYADCQVYHVCEDMKTGRRGSAFLCPIGTIFNQQKLACDWWYNVDCYKSPKYFNQKSQYKTSSKINSTALARPLHQNEARHIKSPWSQTG